MTLLRDDGHLDLAGLASLLREDRRLHPSHDQVLLRQSDGTTYAELMDVLDLTRADGYPDTVFAPYGGSSSPWTIPGLPPGATRPIEAPAAITLQPDGGFESRGRDGSGLTVAAASILGHEAHCDADTCDILAVTADRRHLLGERPRAVPVAGWLFAKPIVVLEGRTGLPRPSLIGTLSPLVGYPEAAAPTPSDANARPFAPIVFGSLEKSVIDAVIKGSMNRIRACYNTLLTRRGAAAGKLTMKFAIGPDGHVSSALVKSGTIEDRRFQTCVVGVFTTLVFPSPPGGGVVVVSYPFVFSR